MQENNLNLHSLFYDDDSHSHLLFPNLKDITVKLPFNKSDGKLYSFLTGSQFENLTIIDPDQLNYINNFRSMFSFWNNHNTQFLNLSDWNVHINNSQKMFSGFLQGKNQSVVESVDLSNWNYELTDFNLYNIGLNIYNFDDNRNYYNYFVPNMSLANWKINNVNNLISRFSNMLGIHTLNLANWDIEKVESLYSCFNNSSIINLNLANWNTNNVKNLSNMFFHCYYLENLDVSNWDTTNVVDVNNIFENCNNLKNLNLSSWDTRNVTNHWRMFRWMQSLENLNVCNFNFASQNNLYGLFEYTLNLKNIDTSNWNLVGVKSLTSLFNGCNQLKEIDATRWNTASVESFARMFGWCDNLQKIYGIQKWNSSNVWATTMMFDNCFNLTDLNLSKWDTQNLTGMYGMFYGCNNLKNLDLSYWAFNENINTNTVFYKAGNLNYSYLNLAYIKNVVPLDWREVYFTDVNLAYADYLNQNSLANLFTNFNSLKNLDLTGWGEFGQINNFSNMFNGCSNLSNNILLDIQNWNVQNIESFYCMFDGCRQFTNLNLTKWNVASGKMFVSMFPTSLVSLNLYNWNINNANIFPLTYLRYLTDLNVQNMKTSNLNSLNFYEMRNINIIDLDGWDLSNIIYMNNAFMNCYNLQQLIIRNKNLSKLQNINCIFAYSNNIKYLNFENLTFGVWDNNSHFRDFWNWNNVIFANLSNWTFISNIEDNELKITNAFKHLNADNIDMSNWNINIKMNLTGCLYTDGWNLLRCNNWKIYNNVSLYHFISCNSTRSLTIKDWYIEDVNNFYWSEFIDNIKFEMLNLYHWTFNNANNIYFVIPKMWSNNLFLNYLYCNNWNINIDNIKFSGFSDYPYNAMYRNVVAHNWIFSNINTFSSLFASHNNLIDINACNWRIRNINQIGILFSWDPLLKNINIYNWTINHLNENNGLHIASQLPNLTNINLANWKVENITNFSRMFEYCNNLTDLDFEGWDFSNAKDMSSAFYYCLNLKNINNFIDNLVMAPLNNISFMFNYCRNLGDIFENSNINQWNVENVQSAANMFSQVTVHNLDLSGWNTSNFQNIENMLPIWNNSTLNLSGWNLANVINYNNFLGTVWGRNWLINADYSDMVFDNFTWISNYLYGTNLFNLNISNWQTTGNQNWATFDFHQLHNLNIVNISNWRTVDLVYCDFNFDNCNNLYNIDLTGWNLDHNNIMDPIFTFKGCNNLSDYALQNIANALLSGTFIEGRNLYPNYNDSLFYQSTRYINNNTVGPDIVEALREREWEIPE